MWSALLALAPLLPVPAPQEAFDRVEEAGPPVSAPFRTRIDRDRIYVNPDPDGTWIRGRTYKARVDPGGFRYLPYLGAGAERNWPLALSLVGARVGEHELTVDPTGDVGANGHRHTIDRGDVAVHYDVAIDSVAQSFTVDTGGRAGDVVLELSLATDLHVRPDGGGARFETARGGVSYGAATAFDGERVLGSVDVHVAQDTLRLHVPAALVARVRDELIVDPILSTFIVDDFFSQEEDVDVAYGSVHDRFAYVWEDSFSQDDVDVFQASYDSNGVLQDIGYVDSGTAKWEDPSIAYLKAHDAWLVVARRENAQGFGHDVVGRMLYGASMNVGVLLEWGFGATLTTNGVPDVGGSWSDDPSSRFLVAWERDGFAASQIAYVLVDVQGVDTGLRYAGSGQGGFHRDVRVSPSTGDPILVDRWNVVARRVEAFSGESTIVGTQIEGDGTIPAGGALSELGPTNPGNLAALYDVSDAVALRGLAPTYVVLHARRGHFRPNTEALVCRGTEAVGRQGVNRWIRGTGSHLWPEARVAATPYRFVITTTEARPNTGTEAAFISEWDLTSGDRLACAALDEALVNPAGLDEFPHQVAIASRYSGGYRLSRICGLGWDARGASDSDIVGAMHLGTTTVGAASPFYCQPQRHPFVTRYPQIVVQGDTTVGNAKTVHLYGALPNVACSLYVTPGVVVPPNDGPLATCDRPLCISSSFGTLGAVSDASGGVTWSLDPTQLPNGGGVVSAMSGETWGLQVGFATPGGGACAMGASNVSWIQFE